MKPKLISVELYGLEGQLIEIEIDKRAGRPAFIIVGLPDTAVQEARERVTSAIKNSGFQFPRSKVIVNLAPANLRKTGPRYDLAIALGILAMTKQIQFEWLKETALLGELALSGDLRPIRGILSSVEHCQKNHLKRIILPHANAREACLIPNIQILAAKNLKEVILHLKGKISPVHIKAQPESSQTHSAEGIQLIRGQEQAKRALEIAAAGGHNLLLHGAPGAGKTMMAKALSTLLPTMVLSEQIEISKIYSIAGLIKPDNPLMTLRPFRSIHHTASAISIVGGGNQAGPGEITLAHRGVLFMDEIAEFPKATLETLRQPLEEGQITISRAKGKHTYPCHFTMVAAMNPCPCGYFGSDQRDCQCNSIEIQRYQKKISGPLMDRIDLFVKIKPVETSKLTQKAPPVDTDVIKKRIENAVKMQRERYQNSSIKCNAELKNHEIEKWCPIDNEGRKMMHLATEELRLSARGYFKVLKLARTIADLESSKSISPLHISEALQYRKKL